MIAFAISGNIAIAIIVVVNVVVTAASKYVPQISRCMRCPGTIIGSHVKLLCLDLMDTMIEVGMKQNKVQVVKKTERGARLLR